MDEVGKHQKMEGGEVEKGKEEADGLEMMMMKWFVIEDGMKKE